MSTATLSVPRPEVKVRQSVETGNWAGWAMRRLASDRQRSADTHLIKLEIPLLTGIDLYLKDESSHPTGSLKHRLARSLFTHAICSGRVNAGTPIVEASSGSSAVSEAYFARLLGLPFTAVMPLSTAKKKIEQIERFGGRCHFVNEASEVYGEARRLARETGGHYMDQFTYAEQATDWRGEDSIAASIDRQMAEEEHPQPAAIVMSAGTGGTAATLGRYIRYQGYATKLIVVDPENSVFYDSYRSGDRALKGLGGSRIEGIGRPQVEPSFLPELIDAMFKVPDAASIAAIYWLERISGRRAGASTGTNLWGALQLAAEMKERGEQGSIVTLMCDGGERYLDTYWKREWVEAQIGCLERYETVLSQYA
ncbi:PLP-dependent cysteine synthase family protein [Marinobacterium sp. D7]|uniref:PLP-dependent cysteine synthase family protein n=1 Tax=Marinobacterium ramblicola TaxID=2849041 RepID=UPI001C2DB4E6|nr:PLP-dependent cysteine synthase family protein [Marinobacterium ramblicola]MBV1789712.1 PLP-dependent cysteine synthase family protein [Marinobacterium ramblicola]